MIRASMRCISSSLIFFLPLFLCFIFSIYEDVWTKLKSFGFLHLWANGRRIVKPRRCHAGLEFGCSFPSREQIVFDLVTIKVLRSARPYAQSVNKKQIIVYEQHAHYSWQGVNFEHSFHLSFGRRVQWIDHTFVSKFEYQLPFLIDDDIVILVRMAVCERFAFVFSLKIFSWSLIICDFDYSCDSKLFITLHQNWSVHFFTFMTKR